MPSLLSYSAKNSTGTTHSKVQAALAQMILNIMYIYIRIIDILTTRMTRMNSFTMILGVL